MPFIQFPQAQQLVDVVPVPPKKRPIDELLELLRAAGQLDVPEEPPPPSGPLDAAGRFLGDLFAGKRAGLGDLPATAPPATNPLESLQEILGLRRTPALVETERNLRRFLQPALDVSEKAGEFLERPEVQTASMVIPAFAGVSGSARAAKAAREAAALAKESVPEVPKAIPEIRAGSPVVPPPTGVVTPEITDNVIRAGAVNEGEALRDAIVRLGPPPQGYTISVPPGNKEILFVKRGLTHKEIDQGIADITGKAFNDAIPGGAVETTQQTVRPPRVPKPEVVPAESTPAAPEAPAGAAAKQPWEMTQAEFGSQPGLPTEATKPGYKVLYHRVHDEADLERLLTEGIDPAQANSGKIGADMPGAFWTTDTPTGYSKVGTVIAVQVPEGEVRGAGIGQFTIHNKVSPQDIIGIDRKAPPSPVVGDMRISDLVQSGYADAYHRDYVKQALAEGKPVSHNVVAEFVANGGIIPESRLADYLDLAAARGAEPPVAPPREVPPSSSVPPTEPPIVTPPVPPSPSALPTGGAARRQPFDPLRIRDTGDVLGDPKLRQGGVVGAARTLVGKVAPVVGKLHPGFGNPADDMAALSAEHHDITNRASSYVSSVFDNIKAAASGDFASGKGLADQQVLDAALVAEKYLPTYARGTNAGRWIDNRLREYLTATEDTTDPETLATLASTTIREMMQGTTNLWYRAKVGSVVPKTASRGARSKFEVSGQFFDFPFVQGYNNVLRSFRSKIDASISGIQLWMLGHRYPKEFAHSLGGMFKSVVDPEYLGKLAIEKQDIVQSMIKHNVHWLGQNPLELEGASVGGIRIPRPANLYGKAAVDLAVLPGRALRVAGEASDRMFQSGSNEMRLRVWESLLKKFPNATESELDDLGKILNSLTGVTSTETTGIEQVSMFASRFVRSPLEVVGAILHGKGPEARLTREASAIFFSVATSITILANYARGKETSFDPDDPNFMKIRDVNGQDTVWYGPWYPYMQAFGKAIKNGPWEAARFAQSEGLDPKIAAILLGGTIGAGADFVGGRLSPAGSLVRDISTQTTFRGGKFENPFDTGDWGKFFALMAVGHLIPFAPSQIAESIVNEFRKKGDPAQSAVNAATGVFTSYFGIKSSPLSKTDYYDSIVNGGDYKKPDGSKATRYSELGPNSQQSVQKEFQNLGASGMFMKSEPVTVSEKVGSVKDLLYTEQLSSDNELRKYWEDPSSSSVGPLEWGGARKARWNGVATLQKLLDKDPSFQRHVAELKEKAKSGDFARFWNALDGYYKLGANYQKPYGLGLDDEYFNARDVYLSTLPPDELNFVRQEIHSSSTDLEKEYIADLQILTPYITMAQTVAEEYGLEDFAKKLEDTPEGESRRALVQSSEGKVLSKVTASRKKVLKTTDPKIAELLTKWYAAKPAGGASQTVRIP